MRLVFLFILVLVFQDTFAQDYTSIHGRIFRNGKPADSTRVVVFQDGMKKGSAMSGKDGFYEISLSSSGNYDIVVSKGEKWVGIANVSLLSPSISIFNFYLASSKNTDSFSTATHKDDLRKSLLIPFLDISLTIDIFSKSDTTQDYWVDIYKVNGINIVSRQLYGRSYKSEIIRLSPRDAGPYNIFVFPYNGGNIDRSKPIVLKNKRFNTKKPTKLKIVVD